MSESNGQLDAPNAGVNDLLTRAQQLVADTCFSVQQALDFLRTYPWLDDTAARGWIQTMCYGPTTARDAYSLLNMQKLTRSAQGK